jgi:hypothetical protein
VTSRLDVYRTPSSVLWIPEPFQMNSNQVTRPAFNLTRKEFLQVGFSGMLGLGLTDLISGRQARGETEHTSPLFGRAKSVVLVFLTGAPSHQDIWDLKPEAPVGIRGDYSPIDTNVPGVQIGPHVPRLAQIADKYAIVRSMTHDLPGHEQATHFVLTGVNQLPPGATHMASRNDWPCYSAGLQELRPRGDGLPTGVMLPTYLHNGYGFSGQTGGFMGSRLDPWHVTKDPNAANFQLDELTLQPGISIQRVDDRRSLLSGLDQQRRDLESVSAAQPLSRSRQEAYQLLSAGGRFREAFEMDREPAEMRDRYGRHAFGQSLLLARRLIEAGMPIVQANMGSMNNWDTHGNNFGQLKDRCCRNSIGDFRLCCRTSASEGCWKKLWSSPLENLAARRRSILGPVATIGRACSPPSSQGLVYAADKSSVPAMRMQPIRRPADGIRRIWEPPSTRRWVLILQARSWTRWDVPIVSMLAM